MTSSMKITTYGGVIFLLLTAAFSILGRLIKNFWMDDVYFVAPILAASFFMMSKLVSLRRKGQLSIRLTMRAILSAIGIFICIFFLGSFVDIIFASEFFFLFNPSLLSIVFVVFRVSERSWLYAGLSQFLGCFIVLFVFIVFLRPTGEAWMAVPMLLIYAFVGFCLGAFIGFIKDSMYIWMRQSDA